MPLLTWRKTSGSNRVTQRIWSIFTWRKSKKIRRRLRRNRSCRRPEAPALPPIVPPSLRRLSRRRFRRPIDVAAERAQFPNFASSIGAEMLLVPSGVFQMGSEAPDAAPNERPITPVTLSRYYISRHPITNAQYELFDPSHAGKRAPGAGDRHPVVYVSSNEAAKFCQWLSSRERRRYRLPTEAEWEYAARGTDGRKYPWGHGNGRAIWQISPIATLNFAWSDREIDDGFAESSPVGAFPCGASPFGMEDMAGNVWEWCIDFLRSLSRHAQDQPARSSFGAKRVYRGGSWKSRFNSLRATTRGANVPNYSCNDLGFRIVCECECRLLAFGCCFATVRLPRNADKRPACGKAAVRKFDKSPLTKASRKAKATLAPL